MSGPGRRSEPTDRCGDLYRAAEGLLEKLCLGRTFTLDELHRRIEERQGRPVHLIAHDLPAPAPHGLWVSGEHADYIFYDGAAAPVRQHQIIGHELGHVLQDGDAPPAAVEDTASTSLPDEASGGPLRVYERSSYDLPAERRAEVFGTVVVQRLHSWRPIRQTTDPDVIARVSAVLRDDWET